MELTQSCIIGLTFVKVASLPCLMGFGLSCHTRTNVELDGLPLYGTGQSCFTSVFQAVERCCPNGIS